MVPREGTAAPCSWATYATAIVSLWTSIPIKSVLDCAMVDLREFSVDVATSSGTGFGKLTRVPLGVNLPPLEVIMSRLLPRYGHAALVRHAVERHQLPISRGVLCQNPTSRRSLRYPSSRRLQPSRFRPPRSWRSARSTRASLLRRSPKSFLMRFARRSPCTLKARSTSGGLLPHDWASYSS